MSTAALALAILLRLDSPKPSPGDGSRGASDSQSLIQPAGFRTPRPSQGPPQLVDRDRSLERRGMAYVLMCAGRKESDAEVALS